MAETDNRVRPAVYTIPAHISFADALAERLLREAGDDPLDLAHTRIFVPNRRAARALADAFLRLAGGSILLPRLQPLGDLDALDDVAVLSAETEAMLPLAVGSFERLLALAPLVQRWAQSTRGRMFNDAEVLKYARALARQIDQFDYAGVRVSDLKNLTPESYAGHWHQILTFLNIILVDAVDAWKTAGKIGPAARRVTSIQALTSAWEAAPPAEKLIIAGSTGSIPAVADLMRVIARLPQAMVVLPALDLSLDEESWQNLAPSHAQYALKQLLERMKISRAEVLPWPSDMVPTAPAARSSAVNAALWPALRTAGWRHVEIETSAFRDVQFLEAASDTEEARAIALHVRAHLETPAKTIAIVTADRALARRISSALSRFDIAVDDSAGSDLAKTSAAVLLLQLARVAANGLLPVDLLALLKHPLCTAGLGRAPWLERVRLLDAEVLRGIRPASGLQGLQLAIAAAFKYPLKTESNTLVSDLHERLTRCAAGFFDLMQQTHVRAQDLLQAHIAAAEMLASSDIVAGDVLLWRGDAGDLLAQTVRDLAAALPPDMELATDSYAMWFEEVLAGKVVRPRYGRHPRVSLLSPIEARLQREDVMILAGLNEGTWPPAPEVDPFLADHMREKLGLPTSEFRLGQSAHDFAQSLGAKEVLLTRSQKSGGAPTLASRFWLRLSALCGDAIAPADTLLAQTRALDQTPLRPAAAPMPVPPQAARPPEIYVSDMTLWRQNPYAFYARRFLNLTPLDDIDADPGPQQRGIALHTALEHFFKREAPKRTLANLLADGEAAFADMMDRPLLRAFWWPRFVTLAKAVVADEKLMVPADVKIHVEKTGGWDMPTTFPLTIKGRADRIDEQPDKKLVIYDYKSGGTPSGEEVRYARQPQMALLALIAQAGSFSDIAKHEVAALKYVLLKGRLPEPLELKELVKKNWSDVSALTALTADILTRWVNLFDVDRQPYRFLQIPDRKPGHEYDHLARVSEWRGRGVP